MSEELLNAAFAHIAETEMIYTIQDADGIPTTENAEGEQTMPFWSSSEKATAFIEQVSGYESFSILAVDWAVFSDKWVPGLDADKLLAGLDWEGEAEAKGFDLEPFELLEKVSEFM